jgi:predicted RNA-binding Zn ribbon-like protein
MGNAAVVQASKGKAYAETFRCPAGALCLDFCNSGQGARGSRQLEWIADFSDLVDWLEMAAAITAPQAAWLRKAGAASSGAANRLWVRAIRFRETLARVLSARAAGCNANAGDLAAIETEYVSATSYARLSWKGTHFGWSLDGAVSTLAAVMQPLLESAVGLLTSEKLVRLRRCGNPTCYWLFIDETKNHSRRWCEMASCGNVIKVRRHRERTRRMGHAA